MGNEGDSMGKGGMYSCSMNNRSVGDNWSNWGMSNSMGNRGVSNSMGNRGVSNSMSNRGVSNSMGNWMSNNRSFRVDSLTFISNFSNISVVSISLVVDMLGSSVRESN